MSRLSATPTRGEPASSRRANWVAIFVIAALAESCAHVCDKYTPSSIERSCQVDSDCVVATDPGTLCGCGTEPYAINWRALEAKDDGLGAVVDCDVEGCAKLVCAFPDDFESICANRSCVRRATHRRKTPGFDLRVSLQKHKYAIGEAIDLDVDIANTGSKAVLFPTLAEQAAPKPVLTIVRPDGQAIVHDMSTPARENKEYTLRNLQQGEWTGEALRLSEVAGVDQPGDYKITARFQWHEINLESAPITFRLESVHLSEMVLLTSHTHWGLAPSRTSDDLSIFFRLADSAPAPRLSMLNVMSSDDYPSESWPVRFGKDVESRDNEIEPDAHLFPVEAYTSVGDADALIPRITWNRHSLKLRWNADESPPRFDWRSIRSPKPIARAVRYLGEIRLNPGVEDQDDFVAAHALVLFEGEEAELGYARAWAKLRGDKTHKHSALRPVAKLGPGLTAIQATLVQLGSPILVVAIRAVRSGSEAVFLRIAEDGAITAQTQLPLPKLVSLGPVAVAVREKDSEIEVAFAARKRGDSGLRMVRLKTTPDLRSIEPPAISEVIPLDAQAVPLAIAYSDLLPSRTNTVGLLLRQPDNKTLFWTEAGGLKPLPLRLHETDETILWQMYSSWYLIVNDGTRLRREIIGAVAPGPR
jgi:hypothetical protein